MQITVNNLAVRYDLKRVLDGLSLAIPSGSFFTLLGPSGCGKTTLLRAIAGFAAIDAGRLLFGATDVTRLPAHKRNIGMVFQDYALFPDKTVFDNVAYGLRARRLDEAAVKQRVHDGLERVGLGQLAARHPAALSGGQRQRVALMRALVIKPDVLLMDEPLSNLDAKLRAQVRATITELQREAGITTIFVTHDQEEALAMSDQIGVMNQGRLEQIGTPAEIYRTPRTAYVADFVGAANLVAVDLPQAVAANTMTEVMLAGVRVAAIAPSGLAAGKARLAVRPEEIRLSRGGTAPGEAAAVISGRITQRQYLGGRTHYVVTLAEAGAILTVDCSGDGHDAFALQDQVTLSFDPAKTLVLA
jgi:iron(III) transport system ATP-binding protein